jgi:hypothetical protein
VWLENTSYQDMIVQKYVKNIWFNIGAGKGHALIPETFETLGAPTIGAASGQISGTEKEQEKNLHSIIEPALKELSHEWNGSNVFVAPNMQFGYEKFATDPMEDSFIYVTDSEYNPDLNIPSFTMFVDSETRKYQIDDILEAGDRDFFKNPSVEADYFNLVNFLKSGKLKKTKSVTVYTARPRKDREVIQKLVDKGLFFYLNIRK